EMMRATGAPGTAHLREMLERGSDVSGVSSVGLLSRLEPAALEPSVLNGLPKWSLTQHDLLIRQLAFGNSPQRGVMLAGWLSKLHPLLQPEALDEMGMAGDRRVSVLLLQIAGGELKQMDAPYVRLKAIEALGRLREPQAAALLRQLVESKKMWGWEHAHELRLVAAQALSKLDPPWAKSRLAAAGLSPEELNLAPPLDPGPSVAWSRARRYPRLQLALSLPAVVTSGASKQNLAIKVLNLGGGLAKGEVPVGGGHSAVLEMRSGFRTIRAEVLVREARSEQLTYEVVQMNFDERAKLRRLLAGLEAVAI
ncbi:MAG: HEAT repeat domain-containing protein, partial [Terriglobales bacterium]